MKTGYKLFEGSKDFEKIQLEMAIFCDENGYCLEDGYEDGKRYLIINPPYQPTLEEVQQAKMKELKAQRDALEVEDIEVNGNIFDYDDKARERINNAIIALQASGGSIYWTLADNQSVKVTASDLIEVVSAVAVRSNALHIAYRDAKEAVSLAETVEEVNAVELEHENA